MSIITTRHYISSASYLPCQHRIIWITSVSYRQWQHCTVHDTWTTICSPSILFISYDRLYHPTNHLFAIIVTIIMLHYLYQPIYTVRAIVPVHIVWSSISPDQSSVRCHRHYNNVASCILSDLYCASYRPCSYRMIVYITRPIICSLSSSL